MCPLPYIFISYTQNNLYILLKLYHSQSQSLNQSSVLKIFARTPDTLYSPHRLIPARYRPTTVQLLLQLLMLLLLRPSTLHTLILSPLHRRHALLKPAQIPAQHLHRLRHTAAQRRMELESPLRRHVVPGAAQLVAGRPQQRQPQLEVLAQQLQHVRHVGGMLGGKVLLAHQRDQLRQLVALHARRLCAQLRHERLPDAVAQLLALRRRQLTAAAAAATAGPAARDRQLHGGRVEVPRERIGVGRLREGGQRLRPGARCGLVARQLLVEVALARIAAAGRVEFGEQLPDVRLGERRRGGG